MIWCSNHVLSVIIFKCTLMTEQINNYQIKSKSTILYLYHWIVDGFSVSVRIFELVNGDREVRHVPVALVQVHAEGELFADWKTKDRTLITNRLQHFESNGLTLTAWPIHTVKRLSKYIILIQVIYKAKIYFFNNLIFLPYPHIYSQIWTKVTFACFLNSLLLPNRSDTKQNFIIIYIQPLT